MPALLCACTVTYVPLAFASSTATAISATVNWVSLGCWVEIATTAPVTSSLTNVAPRRNPSRTFLRSSSGPSDSSAQATRPGIACWSHRWVGSHSAPIWPPPPVWLCTGPHCRIRGPGILRPR